MVRWESEGGTASTHKHSLLLGSVNWLHRAKGRRNCWGAQVLCVRLVCIRGMCAGHVYVCAGCVLVYVNNMHVVWCAIRSFLSRRPGALAIWLAGQTLGAMVLLFTYPRDARSYPMAASWASGRPSCPESHLPGVRWAGEGHSGSQHPPRRILVSHPKLVWGSAGARPDPLPLSSPLLFV